MKNYIISIVFIFISLIITPIIALTDLTDRSYPADYATNYTESSITETEKKSEELKAKAETKRIQASTEETNAVVSQQEANRIKNEAVLQTFGINKHLPDWLLKIMVFLFLFSILHLRSRLLLGECDYLVDIFCNPSL